MWCDNLQEDEVGWSLCDGINGIDNSREVAKKGEHQADPKLYLQ